MPAVGGEPDLAQYLQVLPGVIFTGDQGGQLYIRGGAPVHNLTLLDGMVIYNPFHSIGFFSVFDTDIIRNADVYTGGMPAEYGGRISSTMDVSIRDGNKNRLAGKIGASTFATKLMLEGPLRNNEKGSTTFLVSAKHSYLEESSQLFYDGAGFVGSNLIKQLLKDHPQSHITSLDNHWTGTKENHIDSPRVKYVTGNTWDIDEMYSDEPGVFDLVFHFGEYSRWRLRLRRMG